MTKTASRPLILAVLGGLLLAGAGSVGGASGDLLWTAEDRSAIAACTTLAAGNGSVFAYSWMRDDSSVPLRPRLRALDLADGDLLWQVDDPPREYPVDVTFIDGLVLTTSWLEANPGTSIGTIFTRARDASSGDLLWQQSLGPGRFRYETTAIAADSRTTAVVGARRTAADPLNIFDFFVAAYDTTSGQPLWSDAFDVSGDWDRAEAVAVAGGVVAVGGKITDSFLDLFHVRAHRARSGELLWQDSVDGGEARAMKIGDGRLYVTGHAGFEFADGSHLRAYGLVTGRPLWSRSVPRAWMESLAVLGPRIIAGGSRKNGRRAEVGAYDRESGQRLWRSRKTRGRLVEVVARRNLVFAVGTRRSEVAFTRSWFGRSGVLRWAADIGTLDRREPEAQACAVELADQLIVSYFEELPDSGDPTLPRQVLRAFEP